MRAVLLLLAATVLVAGPAFAGRSSRPGAPSASPPPAFAGCGPPAAIRPDFILLGCGDGGQYLASIRWSYWLRDRALGTAVWWQNLCTPDCAAGHFRRDRVTVSLYRPRLCPHRKRDWFTRMALRYVDAPPRGAPDKPIVVKAPFLLANITCP